MTGVFIAFGIVLMVPLFMGTWRASLLGLSCQGFLMAWFALRHGIHPSASAMLELVDLVMVRAIAVPLVLYRVLKRQNAPPRNDVIAPNLLSWAIALGFVLLAFRLADTLVPIEGERHLLIAVSTLALLLGLLILSMRSGPLSQTIGALHLENSIALFELGAEAEHESPGLRVGLIAVVVLSLAFFRWYLTHLTPDEPGTAPAEGVAS